MDDLTITFGEGWRLATWSAPDAHGVQLLVGDGIPSGWTALLPEGPWGLGGWIAVEHQGDGQPDRHPADSFGRPQRSPTPDLALDVLHRAAVPAALADEVPVPDLALGRATGWTPPTDRGLGDPRRDYALGDGLVHLTWPGNPGIQALEQRGHQAGWTEVYDDEGNWAALIAGRLVADAADNEPLLADNPAEALTLLRLALAQNVGTQ
ncbi:hypothetical protein [Kitasatospora sp. NPDC092286]|uniref:hypothetical protein n=1 Tax=Kitasatospora sp. NPDC092286 TaxID=3364087 RepID=UPI00382DDF84